VSNERKPPSPPPSDDDWGMTKPNVSIPGQSQEPAADWDKTNYNLPKQPPA